MIPIGKFSAASQCSIKTLRYYDKIGLLKPAKIDPDNGYRYYNAAQLDTMIQINRYKRYGFSLEQIRILLEEDETQIKTLLINQIRQLKAEREELERSITDLSILLQYSLPEKRTASVNRKEPVMNPLDAYEIDLCQREEQPILAIRGRFGIGDFGQYFGRLFQTAAQNQIQPSQVTGARYYDQEFDPMSNDTEVFVFVENSSDANAALPGGLYVHTVHTGPYSHLFEAYAALTKWMDEHQLLSAGAPWELYTKIAFNGTPADEWKTDIYFPVVQS